MPKPKTIFVCSACGYESPRWYGKCPSCESWNTLEETAPQAVSAIAPKPQKQRGGTGAQAQKIYEIEAGAQTHEPTGIGEFDRVLGGGIVEGSLMLVGGEPGVGKSTLLLQVCARMARMGKRVLYVTGEESTRQIRLRADRLGVGHEEILVLAENAMDAIEEKFNTIQPDFAVIDSIQTMYRPDLASAPGSVSQVRESAAVLMRYAKTNGCAIILVGHVTKEGAIAGPRVLEHMVDVVLYFEGDYQHEYRLLRAVKNRFGSVNELGMFEMTGEGMMPRGPAARWCFAAWRAAARCWWICRRWRRSPFTPCRAERSTARIRRAWRCCWRYWKSARACACTIRTYMLTSLAACRCLSLRLICRCAWRWLPPCLIVRCPATWP